MAQPTLGSKCLLIMRPDCPLNILGYGAPHLLLRQAALAAIGFLSSGEQIQINGRRGAYVELQMGDRFAK